MSRNQTICLFIAFGYFFLSACSKKQAEEITPSPPTAPGVPPVQVSYTDFVAPLLQARCAGCHAAGRQAAPIFTLSGYASITANADRIKNAVLVKKSMPIGTALTAAQLQSLQDWFDQGMPQ